MPNSRADVFCYLIVVVLVLAPFGHVAANSTNPFKQCSTEKAVEQCGKNQRCVQNNVSDDPRCECLIDYELIGGQCIQVASTVSVNATTVSPDFKPSSGGSSVAAGLLIPTFLVVIGVLLYFGARRYKWLQRFRQFRQNRYGNVLVTRDDDDDDDPPIA